MNDSSAEIICGHLVESESFSDLDERGRAENQYKLFLRTLPQPDAQTFDRGPTNEPRALLVVESLLVEVSTVGNGQGRRISARTRQLADNGTTVEVEWGPRERWPHGEGHKTHWILHFLDGEPISLEGQVQIGPHEALDGAEEFARLTASKVGMTQESARA